MQLPLPLLSRSSDAARRVLVVSGRAYVVVVARHRRARRYVLRLADQGTLRLTVPRGASVAAGLRFAEGQRPWIERERQRLCLREQPWRDGTAILFRGRLERLHVRPGEVVCGSERIARVDPDTPVRAVVEHHLRALATTELSARCLELARAHRLPIARVAVRNQRSRWGACSARGVITLNWRLIQMPARVADYVILHELAHLRQPNHSPRFWREVEAVCPEWREAERWLRRNGRNLTEL
jgi:predicted metal-dependent hydrolase